MLGANPGVSVPQYGLFARTVDRGRPIGINLNDPQCISLFGQPGAGKSYSLGTLIEMATQPVDNVNVLPSPLCSIIYHYADSEFYPPEFVSMVNPNTKANEIEELQRSQHVKPPGWGAKPTACSDLIILAPAAMVEKRKREFPGIPVYPASFHPRELAGSHWKYLMGAVGSGNLYLRVLKNLIRELAINDRLSIDNVRAAIDGSRMDDIDKRMAQMRLDIAARFVDEGSGGIGEHVKPGRIIIVDARDEFIEKEEIFAVLLVMLQVFSSSNYQGKPVNKLVVFDEAHQYLCDQDLIDGMISLIRVMRHKRTTICFASQDPISIPKRVIELSTQLIMHKMISKEWLAHIASVNAAVDALKPSELAFLNAGEAMVWSQRASEDAFTKQCYKAKIRPRVSMHGGFTKSATGT
jgi:hypothetical protein